MLLPPSGSPPIPPRSSLLSAPIGGQRAQGGGFGGRGSCTPRRSRLPCAGLRGGPRGASSAHPSQCIHSCDSCIAHRALTPQLRVFLALQPMPVIGFLSSRSPSESNDLVAAFRRGLRDAGFIEGQNLLIAFRWAEGRYDRLSALAAELVDLRVAVLFTAGGPPAALAAKAATQTIPVVFSAVSDAVRVGLVASLNRPGGNLTGMSLFTYDVAAKGTQFLKELLPTATAIAYLVNSSNPTAELYVKEAASTASALGISVHVLSATTEHELDGAFASTTKLGVKGVVVPAEPFFDSRRDIIVALAARYAVPTVYSFREYAVAGGLMAYGASLPDAYRQGGIYVGRVLKGEKPGDLPVMQPTKFDLVINLKTARALGLTMPDRLLALADEVID
jgi:putative tryptophan/tyrosine transport system substrate-binding protein